MKLQSPTLILVCLAVALGSFVAVTELRPGSSGDEGDSQSLFSFEEEEVRSLLVKTSKQTLTFDKEDSPSDSPDFKSSDSEDNVVDSDGGDGRIEDDAVGSDSNDAKERDADESTESTVSEEEASSAKDKEDREADESSSDADAADSSAKAAAEDLDEDLDNVSDSGADASDSDAGEESTDEVSADADDSREGSDSETMDSEWWMRSPDETPADDPTVIFLVNLMASGVSDRVFDVVPENLDDFGFDSPLAEVEVTLENDESHRLILGNYDFNGNNIYAQTISSSGEEEGPDDAEDDAEIQETVEVFIVSTSFDAAINRPLEEWKRSANEDEDDEESTDSSDLEDDEESDDS